MKIFVKRTLNGLQPCYDEDYEKFKELKVDTDYRAVITIPRNIRFHNKFFGMLRCAWEYQNEEKTAFFKNSFNVFRDTVFIASGICDVAYSVERKEWIEQAKSVAFESMDNQEFEETYNRVADILLKIFLKDINESEFRQNIGWFL